MPPRATCDVCATVIEPHAHYIVRIDVFADPSIPELTSDEIDKISSEQTVAKLMEQMKQMSADELQDGVHRRFEYKLCPACQKVFLSNPLGTPRRRGSGKN